MKTIAAFLAQSILDILQFIANHLIAIAAWITAIGVIIKLFRNLIIWIGRVWRYLARLIAPKHRKKPPIKKGNKKGSKKRR